MKTALVCSGHYDRLRDVGYGKSYGNTIKVIVEAPVLYALQASVCARLLPLLGTITSVTPQKTLYL